MPRRSFVLLFALFLATSAAAQESITTSKIYLDAAQMTSGSGSPEGAVTAPVGSTYYRTDTGMLYVKSSGVGSSGWSAISAAAPYVTGDLLYANGTGSLARLAAPAAGQVLASSGVGVAPAWTASPALTAIGGAANLTLNPSGDIIVGAAGNDVLPSSGYTKNLGALTNKFLTLHAAELWVETLVAQNTMATIGGRVLVGPTTSLTSDLSNVATAIIVKHNQMANGDRVVLQANGQLEWLAVTSGPSGGGPYTYTVTRNLDGSGANTWTAGDAVFNTGQTSDGCPAPGLVAGDGYIDLYSVNGLLPGSTAGPTIVGNVRTGCSYSQVDPRWAIGNLNGLYGYGTDTYGAAFGSKSGTWLKIDPANGVRIGFNEGVNEKTRVRIDAAGNATFDGTVTVGYGRNMLSNSEFRRATVPLPALAPGSVGPSTGEGNGAAWGATLDSNSGLVFTHACNLAGWYPVNGGACYFMTAGTPAVNTYARAWGPNVPVVGGQTYEFSYYYGNHRGGTTYPRVIWYDASGAYITEGDGSLNQTGAAGTWGGTTLSAFGRVWGIHTAPMNAATAVPTILQYYNGGATPYTFYTRVFFGQAHQGQTTPSEWGPGGTTLITGDHLATDLVVSNTIHSTAATSLTSGTGFWLDAAAGTPTFRVGNPAGNQIKWDGTNVAIAAGNLTIDGSSVRIAPTDVNNYTLNRGYAFEVPTGSLGMSGADGPTFGRSLYLRSQWSGVGDRQVSVYLDAISGARQALLYVMTTATFSQVQMNADFVSISSVNPPRLEWPGIGAAGALAGYLRVIVAGAERRIPVYNP